MAGPIPISISGVQLRDVIAGGDAEALYDLLTQPLHEALYRHGSFDLYDDMSAMQQMLVAFDYLQMQASQGGFIQFLNNGYVSLLPDLIEGLNRLQQLNMARILDDALKVYVLNKDCFDRADTVETFAALYEELKEFDALDAEFTAALDNAKNAILDYAVKHIDEIAQVS